MSNDKITVELTVAQAEHLEFRTRLGTNLVVPDGMDEGLHVALDAALASHREEQERASLGTPWEADQNSAGGWHISVGRRWMQFLSGPKQLTEAQAKLMSAAPEMAECLQWIHEWRTRKRSADRPAPRWTEVEDRLVASALRKAGRLK